MGNINVKDEFTATLNKLLGEECWGIVAGEGTGSVISIAFGSKIARKKPINNPHLTADQRQNKSEFDLMVSCAWRLNSDKEIVCSSTDLNDNDGPMVNGLKTLVGHKIKYIDITYPAYDLKLGFDNTLTLYVFCNETNTSDEYDNYVLYFKDSSFTVGTKSVLTYEKS